MTTKWSKGNWIIGISLLVLALVWWKNGENENSDLNYYKVAIELLEQQNDSLVNDNLLLDEKMKKIQLKADSLYQLVTIKSEAIKSLKKVKDEKVKAIDGYSTNKLFQFFTGINTDSSSVGR
jgi:tetrahydromethanopterin S-methyltransferase subunit B